MTQADFEHLLSLLTGPYGVLRATQWLEKQNEHSLAWFVVEYRKRLLDKVSDCDWCGAKSDDIGINGACAGCRVVPAINEG
jgi:hypothetical protein